jgi:hypothetical protein
MKGVNKELATTNSRKQIDNSKEWSITVDEGLVRNIQMAI